MAVIRTEFYAMSLGRQVRFTAVLANDVPSFVTMDNPHFSRPAKTIYLLHGHGGWDSDWLYNSPLTQLAGKYNVNFILPSGENWFYLDGEASDRKYCQYVGKELVDYTRKLFGLSDKKEDTFVGGLSMGGFGALHTGLAFPETFSKIMALSSAFIVHEVKNMEEGSGNPIAKYDYYRMVFGDPKKLEFYENNPEHQIRLLQEAGKEVPPIYMAIGTEDFLYQENQILRKFLEEHKVDFVYSEGPGVHDFDFWNQHLPLAIEWFLS